MQTRLLPRRLVQVDFDRGTDFLDAHGGMDCL